MAVRIKSNPASPAAHKPRTAETAYKTLVASSRQKTFERVLSQFEGAGSNNRGSEIASLQQELQNMQGLQGSSGSMEAAHVAGARMKPDSRASGFNALATSALLQLATVSSKGKGINQHSLRSMGLSASAQSQRQGGMDSQQAGLNGASRVHDGIGSLSAQFESGENGVEVIGYDTMGGTSYGIYQISSRAGTMKGFIEYLEDRAPDWAKRLRTAGPSNTGGRKGTMPAEWKRIAAEDPVRFAKLQHDFIAETHYAPAVQEIHERTGVDINKYSPALKEVLWSTAVQHGPRGATKIFCKAINRAQGSGSRSQLKDVINNVYSSRSGQFGRSSSEVQSAVQGRFREEKAMALAMLSNDPSSHTTRDA